MMSLDAADPLVGNIAKQLLEDRAEHNRMAEDWTRRFAQG